MTERERRQQFAYHARAMGVLVAALSRYVTPDQFREACREALAFLQHRTLGVK